MLSFSWVGEGGGNGAIALTTIFLVTIKDTAKGRTAEWLGGLAGLETAKHTALFAPTGSQGCSAHSETRPKGSQAGPAETRAPTGGGRAHLSEHQAVARPR